MPAHQWVELGLDPLVGRVMPRMCLEVAVSLACLPMGGAVSLPPVTCSARGVQALAPTGSWVGPGLDDNMSASRRARTGKCSLTRPPPVSLSPK